MQRRIQVAALFSVCLWACIYLYWSAVALECCVGCCGDSVTCMDMSPPSWTPQPSGPSQSAELVLPRSAAPPHSLSVFHTIVYMCHCSSESRSWKVVVNHKKTPGFLSSREEFNPGPETRLDRSELLCNKVLLKCKRDIESFWHRHQKGAERVPPC